MFTTSTNFRLNSRLAMVTFCLAFGIVFGGQADACSCVEYGTQQSSKTQDKTVDQTKLVRSIYEATKTAKSAKELSAFVKKCEAALKQGLTPANAKYVSSLCGWAMNRRGNKRLELAQQLKSIGNSQYKNAMKQAMEDFDKAVTLDPTRYRSWMSRGIAFMETKDYRKAALDFTSVIKLKTDLANGWFNRAEALYHFEKYEQAASDYGVVLSMDSDDAQALTGRGHSNFELGKLDEAVKDYKRVIELLPRSESAYINLGDVCQRLGKWEEATKHFEKSLALKPNATAYQRMAWLMATCSDKKFRNADKSIQFAKRAIEMAGDTAMNLDTLAAAEACKGNFKVALSTQEKVIGLVSAVENENEGEQKVYQSRLALYKKGEPFTEVIETVSKKNLATAESEGDGSSNK